MEKFTPPQLSAHAAENLATLAFTTELWAREQLARFTYKPGWSFDIIPSFGGTLSLKILMKVEDTYHPGQTIEVGGYRSLHMVEYDRNPDMFARALAGFIQELEIHEAREWLKRDGEIYDNPHKDQ